VEEGTRNESASSSSARLSNLSSVNVNATTPVARGNVFLERQSQKQDFVKDMTATAVPIWHPGQEKFKFGGCKYCEKLSLQPHLNRTGQHNKGKLLLRCSSWFRREQGFQCWYSFPFPMGLYHKLSKPMQVEYESLKQSLRRGSN